VCHFIPPRQSRCLRSLAGLCGRNGRLTGADPNPFSSTFKQVGNAIGINGTSAAKENADAGSFLCELAVKVPRHHGPERPNQLPAAGWRHGTALGNHVMTFAGVIGTPMVQLGEIPGSGTRSSHQEIIPANSLTLPASAGSSNPERQQP
ncbi:MAG: hypothetical protein RLQ73_16920, partial [Hoeflea sp. D1-CHI-28]